MDPASEADDRTSDWNPGREAVRANAANRAEHEEVVLEPLVWGLFSLGGFLTAFLLPVVIVALSLAVPLGLWAPERIAYDAYAVRFADPLFRLLLFALIGGALFHGFHRLRHLLLDAGLTRADPLWIVLFYGIATLGSLAALYYTILADWLGIRIPGL